MTEGRKMSARSKRMIFVSAVVFYLIPFTAVTLDEAVFGTHVTSRYAPTWLEPIFRGVYFPFFGMIGR